MKHAFLVLSMFLALPADVQAQATRFDGVWNVTMVCPPLNAADDDAMGYTHRFAGQVTGGQFSATHRKEGEPGWHHLRGRIAEDGTATLRLDGIVNNPKYAINDAPRGKVYSYRVTAAFDETSGTGQRMTGRKCEFRFSR